MTAADVLTPPTDDAQGASHPPDFEQVVKMDREGVIALFKRYPVAFTRGAGSRLWDMEGREYLDFLMGIAVCGLGHCHPKVVAAIQTQAAQLMHTSNLYYIPKQAELAARLHQLSGGFQSYFANSGSEANECALKLTRKVGFTRGKGQFEVITALNSFHGRTLGTISATGQDKVKKGFEPLLPGFRHVPYNDLEALERTITPQTIGIMLEVLQAESANTMPAPGYLEGARRICDERGLLLIFDEVQTGIARSGEMFGWQRFNVRPDIFTLAKALGNGMPISACLALPEVAAAFQPGDHGGTYGGNPLACAAALAVLQTIEEENVLALVQRSGDHFLSRLGKFASSHPSIKDVRGVGLLLAIEMREPVARGIVADALQQGLVINATSDTVIRLRPALNIEPLDIDRGLDILEGLITAQG